MFVVHLSFLHAKRLLMKLLIKNQQTFAKNTMFGLTLANYQPIQYVNLCLFKRRDLNSKTGKFTPRENKTRSFENMVLSYFQRTRPDCKIESFYTTGRQKKNDCFSVDDFCSHCNTVFEAMGCFYHFCPCQRVHPSLTEEDIQRHSKKRQLDALRRHSKHEKGFNVIKKWECEKWRLYKTN